MSDVTSGLKQEYQASLAPEDTVQGPSPNARQVVEVLREIQTQRDELEAKFLQERAALEAKFQKVVSTYIQQFDHFQQLRSQSSITSYAL